MSDTEATQRPDLNQLDALTIPVIAEQLTVDTQQMETGRIRIVKSVQTQEQTVDVPLMNESYEVERVAMNQYVDTAPAVRYEGDTVVYPVLQEVLIVEKRLMLLEEVRVTKRQQTRVETQSVPVRTEAVTVERLPPQI
ncbi:YsnF/AvaK domain-containing protein [Spirosoma montaniterrae]|uniref:DUF2382 domain-containing protein n=1 Tax=Spirosoma montaniterrae TaxID=1178516 RepID=A0A1P9WV72_9BACT|nr:YsnF/AvaK domain-containing protein [Spirosoma montaniterrae]AQG79292.1 hypothetical protein AWR27_08110 [Spirosoma montaniterrae]